MDPAIEILRQTHRTSRLPSLSAVDHRSALPAPKAPPSVIFERFGNSSDTDHDVFRPRLLGCFGWRPVRRLTAPSQAVLILGLGQGYTLQ